MPVKGKQKVSDVVFHGLNTTFFALFAFICAYPFYYIIINSISDNDLVATGQIVGLAQGIHFNNYIEIFQLSGFAHAAFISVAKTVVATVLMVAAVSYTGYAMTRKEYWHRKFWYRFMIVTMYFSAGMIPAYLNIKSLGLLDTFWVYVLPDVISPFNMILVKTYIENAIPDSLEEAAIIDGAGYASRYFRIILPLSKPILATITVFKAVGEWNAYLDTIIYTSSSNLRSLQTILYTYLSQTDLLARMMQSGTDVSEELVNAINPVSARFAITAVTMLPVILIYPFFQRYFTKGIMIGAVKG